MGEISVWPDLYNDVIKKPYDSGYRELNVITGYASAAFLHHVMENLNEVKIKIIIGMIKKDPISIWDHNEFVRLSKNTGRLKVFYYNDAPPIHAKICYWASDANRKGAVFAGSANFSWNGFRDYKEVMVKAPAQLFNQLHPDERLLKECTDKDVFEAFEMRYHKSASENGIDTDAIGALASGKPFVQLPLTQRHDDEVHGRSGLNWGQRDGREPNQAYIPIPREIHRKHPGFFPPAKEEFNLLTDDGENFICTIAQAGDKAIHTKYDNSILGKYFRRRLGVPYGSRIKTEHLVSYGRKSVQIYKIDARTFYLEFKRGG